MAAAAPVRERCDVREHPDFCWLVKRHKVDGAARKELARRYGLTGPGTASAPCFYCGVVGEIHWRPPWTRPANPGWGLTRSKRMPAFVYFDHEIDHVVPVCIGGKSTPGNLVLACQSCNSRKGTCYDGCWRETA